LHHKKKSTILAALFSQTPFYFFTQGLSMSYALIYSRAPDGVAAPMVSVETHLSPGIPSFTIVGLPETAVRESKDRVRSALLTMGFEFPAKRITVNLAPADLPKGGARFDLPIALGILAASKQVDTAHCAHYEFVGELALNGELRPIRGVLPVALAAKKQNRQLIVPASNAAEAALINGIAIFGAQHLVEVCAHLNHKSPLLPVKNDTPQKHPHYALDLVDVKGQQHARRALEIAASGGHSLLMSGPPGTGKTMLASRLPSILPSMTDQQALQTAAITSISHQGFNAANWKARPFRSPHHSASSVALVGGGNPPKPGEISLAHNGVLFLDELMEFSRNVLDALRQPLESGRVTISRAARQSDFPTQFQFLAAMNPCPCGYLSDPSHQCRCTPDQIQRYRSKISGPVLDRIDMHIEVPRLLIRDMHKKNDPLPESSHTVQLRVEHAYQKQQERANKSNAKLTSKEVHQCCQLNERLTKTLENAADKLNLSARAYYRILKVARTIADMSHSPAIESTHLMEALSYRQPW
jgi:magnesium chelatase family protein